jgi:hypothetical protein
MLISHERKKDGAQELIDCFWGHRSQGVRALAADGARMREAGGGNKDKSMLFSRRGFVASCRLDGGAAVSLPSPTKLPLERCHRKCVRCQYSRTIVHLHFVNVICRSINEGVVRLLSTRIGESLRRAINFQAFKLTVTEVLYLVGG